MKLYKTAYAFFGLAVALTAALGSAGLAAFRSSLFFDALASSCLCRRSLYPPLQQKTFQLISDSL